MCAVHPRLLWEHGKAFERRQHLQRRTLEEAPTAGAEQRVPAKQHILINQVIGQVPASMARHPDHANGSPQYLD
ncbi:hypothetical protein D3C81_2125990 [compost metagenome]